MGFPNAVDSADWRFLVDFHSGAVGMAGGVRFWFCFLDNGAISSEETDDWSSLSWSSLSWLSLSDGTGFWMLMFSFEVPAGLSVCNLNPLICSL